MVDRLSSGPDGRHGGLPLRRHGGCHYAGTGACHYAETGNGKYNRTVEKRSKQAAIVSSKSEKPKLLPPAYNHPWRAYGKKINGKPVLNTFLKRIGHF